jgi:hypothetical protein
MNKEENNFEEFLKSKLENHTVEVSDSVWAAIEKKKKKRELFFWFKQYLNVLVALDIVFFIGIIGLSMLNFNEVQSQNNSIELNAQKSRTIKNESNISKAEINNNLNVDDKQIENIKNDNAEFKQAPQKTLAISNNIKKQPDEKVSSKIESKANIKEKKSSTQQNGISQTTLHQNIIEENESVKYYALETMPKKEKLQFINSFNTIPNIIDQAQEFNYLPASIVLTKSKKVLKAEQKAIMKSQENSNKSEVISAKKELEAVSKDELIETKSTLSTENNDANEEASLKIDTVYGKKSFKGYFAIDALISPDITWRNLTANTEQASNFISKRDSAESIRLSYSALMKINLFINRNIYINTGIGFAQNKEKFSVIHKWQTHEDYIDSTKYITYVDPFAGNVIYKTYDTLDYVRTHKDTVNHNLTMTFIDVPVMLGYKWLGKKSGIAIQGGFVYNLMFKQKGTIADYNYTVSDVKRVSENPFAAKAGWSIGGAISANFKLTDQLDFMVEPHTRYFIKPISNADYAIQQKLFTYGLRVGLRLKL